MTETVLFEDRDGKITGLERRNDRTDLPLIVAIHGGGCHAGYFDVPGYSLLDRAQSQGHSVMALNRPGYGGSTPLPEGDETLANNAARLDAVLGGIWASAHDQAPGIVLIGHSIGGAITTLIAAKSRGWPLLGIAISGVMATLTPGASAAWESLPRTGWMERPAETRDGLAFGDDGSFAADAVLLARETNARSACLEGFDIAFEWPRTFETVTARVDVPVHIRQAARDALWVVNETELERFAASFIRAPSVDAAIIPHVGHCIDHHLAGPDFNDAQLAFARHVTP